MAEERIKGVDKEAGEKRPRKNTEDGRSGRELSPEELESVAGGAAFAEQENKKPTL